MKNKHLTLALIVPLTMVMVKAEDGEHMFMRVVIKNEVIVDATCENARALMDAARRDAKRMCHKFAEMDGVMGTSTESYDEMMRRCDECNGFDVMEEDMMPCERCGCNKPKPRTMDCEQYGMDRCGCNKPKPKSMDCDMTRCGCNKPKPRNPEDMQDKCGCNKPKPKGCEVDEATERCGCNKPKPKNPEDMQDKCGCNKPKPNKACDDQRCGCNKPKPKGSEADVANERCGCNKPKPRNPEDMPDKCGCNKPKPKSMTVECSPNCDSSVCCCNS